MSFMHKKLYRFYDTSFKNFFEAIVNVAIFLPYFFSVTSLLRTLFAPWKGLIGEKTTVGFSFNEWFNRLTFNWVSRWIGFFMRISIIITYVLIQIAYVVALPFVIIVYFLMIPLFFIMSQFSKTEDERKLSLKEQFITSHMVKQDSYQEVEIWFERLYRKYYVNKEWWRMANLKSIPPLARDWAMGYTPALDQYTEELTHPSYQSYIKHIVGRLREIDEIERILSKSQEANVILVGDEGVGKHTIIDALSKRIYEGKTNPLLMYRRVLKLNMERVLTKYTDQQQREEFLEELLHEAAAARNVIMMIDNLDKYVSLGDERIDLSIPIQNYAKTSVQIIGLTSPFLYQKYITPNQIISRLFSKIEVHEVNKEEAKEILLDSAIEYEQRYKVYIPYETVMMAVDKSDFYITSIPFPEKAMQLLDNACIYTTQTEKKHVVLPQVIDAVLTEKTHVPTALTPEMKEKLLKLEDLLKQKIVSQPEAIASLASALRRSFLLMGKRKKPLASFLFLGPTGVGKTETAKAITEVFFGEQGSMVRFDMSAYQSKDTLPELIGSLDSQNPGLLTQSVREHPYGVLLLDEIEKADKDLLNIFLTILDEGYFTDGYGKHVDCKNLVVIATSNAGAAFIYDHLKEQSNPTDPSSPPPSSDPTLFQQQLIRHLIDKAIFVPEFLNRFDGVIAYRPLQEDNIVTIARKFLTTVIDQIYAMYKVKVRISDETLQKLAEKSYDPAFGARDMQRILREEIEDKIAKMILEGQAKEGDTINL